jgi:hypothetical protein
MDFQAAQTVVVLAGAEKEHQMAAVAVQEGLAVPITDGLAAVAAAQEGLPTFLLGGKDETSPTCLQILYLLLAITPVPHLLYFIAASIALLTSHIWE